MTFYGFRYYRARTISPDNEYVFEEITWCWLLVLSLSFFPILRCLELRRKRRHPDPNHQGCTSNERDKAMIRIASEPEDISLAMNYAPFLDHTTRTKKSQRGDDKSCRKKQGRCHQGEGRDCDGDHDGKAGGHLVKFLSRLGPRLWKKEQDGGNKHSYNCKNEQNLAKNSLVCAPLSSESNLLKKKEPSLTAKIAKKGKFAGTGKRHHDASVFSSQTKRTSALISNVDASTFSSDNTPSEDEGSSWSDSTTASGAASGKNGSLAVLLGAEDNFDERERQAINVLPHINDHGGWDNIEIYQTSVFQISPFAARNVLHNASGPFLFECGRCTAEGYESDSSDDDDSNPPFLARENSDVANFGAQAWDDLPLDVKMAAETLGIDQSMWVAKIKSKTFNKHWDELTISQQAACVQLGFNKMKWEQRFVSDDFQLPTYEGYDWQDLPPNAVVAAEVLGYSQAMWDNNQDSEVCKRTWKELSEEQKAASLALLGFDQVSWDSNWLTEKFHQGLSSRGTYEHCPWKNLPPKARKAALTLGYNEKTWNSDGENELCMKKWKKLRPEQQSAALELYGFDQRWWDDHVRHQTLLNTFSWNHLPLDAKRAAEALGYNKEVWDKAKKPSISTLTWNTMQQSDRAAWFQLILSIKAQKEHFLYLKSIQDDQKKEAKEERDMQESVYSVEGTKDQRNFCRLACVAVIANGGKPILQVLIIGTILGSTGAYTFVAWMMVNFLLDLCEAISGGLIEAEESICRQATAVGKYFVAAQQVQLSLVLSTILVAPIYFLTALLVDDILIGLSCGGTVAELATTYAPLAVLSRLIQRCLANGLNRLMWNDGRGGTMAKLELSTKILQFILMLVVLVGFQIESIEAVGLIEVVLSLLYTVLIYNSCERFGWLGKYETGLFEHWSLRNKPWAGEFMKMSIPLTTGHILSHGQWFIWTWFAAMMGPAEAAAWIIMQALGVVLLAFPASITNATEIQIGLSIGKGRIDSARQIALRSLFYVVITSVLPVALFLGLRKPIIRFFSNDQSLVNMMKGLVPLVCAGSVMNALGSHCQMILGSIGRAKAGVVIFYVGTYCISLPLATLMVFGAKFGLPSLMMSLVIGYSIIAFTNLLAVYSSDWSMMSRTVLMKAEKHSKALIEMTGANSQAPKQLDRC